MTERGSLALETAALIPVMTVMILVVIVVGRAMTASMNVEATASEAARAASLTQTPGGAQTAATEAAIANLNDSGLACTRLAVSAGGPLTPGSTVTVTVTCQASFADVAFAGVPGERTYTATATEAVDLWRGGGDRLVND